MNKGTLYLIPVTLGDTPVNQVINEIDTYIVENIKTARRFLIKAGIKKQIDDLTFFELNKRTHETEIAQFIKPLLNGDNVGVLSEAGCPGAEVVAIAQQKGITVNPLIGPSSILLSLMASGFNGQNFCFNGYLPKDQKDRVRKIKELERLVKTKNQTQLFIETPYRNRNVIEDIIKNCLPNTKLCVAVDITLPSQRISTKSVEDWKKTKIDLHKRPCIFLLG